MQVQVVQSLKHRVEHSHRNLGYHINEALSAAALCRDRKIKRELREQSSHITFQKFNWFELITTRKSISSKGRSNL